MGHPCGADGTAQNRRIYRTQIRVSAVTRSAREVASSCPRSSAPLSASFTHLEMAVGMHGAFKARGSHSARVRWGRPISTVAKLALAMLTLSTGTSRPLASSMLPPACCAQNTPGPGTWSSGCVIVARFARAHRLLRMCDVMTMVCVPAPCTPSVACTRGRGDVGVRLGVRPAVSVWA